MKTANRLGLQARLVKNAEPSGLGERVYLATIDPLAWELVEKAKPRLLLLHPVYDIIEGPRAAEGCRRIARDADIERGLRTAKVMYEEGVVREADVEGLERYGGGLLVTRVSKRG